MASDKRASPKASVSDDSETLRCHLCSREVSRKHQCVHCWKSVCENHCVKRRFEGSEKPQKICDECDANLMKEEIKKEMQAEIDALERELETAKAQNARLTEENLHKAKELNLLEMECKEEERKAKAAEEDLEREYQAEQANTANARAEMAKLNESLKALQDEERSLTLECQNYDSKLAQLRITRQELQSRKEKMVKTLNDLDNRVRASVPISQLEAIACPKCREKLRTAPQRSGLDMVYEESEAGASTNPEERPSDTESQS